MPNPIGRPTDYNEDVQKIAEEYLQSAIPQNMEIPTVEGLAIKLGVVTKTIYNWSEKHPEFLHTLEKLKDLQKQHLMMTGIFGGKEINPTIVMLLLKVNHNMIETERHEVGGVNGSTEPIRLLVNAGNGFLPATITVQGASTTSTSTEPTTIQSADMAPQGLEDNNSNNGSSQAGTP